MPSCELKTNVEISDPKAFAIKFSKKASEVLGKPESYMTTSAIHIPTLTFKGTTEPAFTMQVISLDNLNPASNEKYSKGFFEFFKEELGIENDRGYITFIDPGRGYLGYQGVTFENIFGKK